MRKQIYKAYISYNYFGRHHKEQTFTDVNEADTWITDHLKRYGSIGLRETLDNEVVPKKWSYGRAYRKNLQKLI